MAESNVIVARVFDPRQPGLFRKANKTERAQFRVLTCKCESSCPLFAAGFCAAEAVMGSGCVYGSWSCETGPTGRAAKYWEWIRERKNRYPGVPESLKYAPKKLAFIGEYVYLPYAHMNMRKDVPFLRHGGPFLSGSDFIKREAWIIDNVFKLIDFRPQALMGGEIATYQTEQVPLFISHVREMDAEMWQRLIAARPQYDVAPNYVGRTALLKTLAHPITIPAYDSRYPVVWEWDGDKARTRSRDAYSDTWGRLKSGDVEIAFTPDDKTAIEVKDNSWVTPQTVFVD